VVVSTQCKDTFICKPFKKS